METREHGRFINVREQEYLSISRFANGVQFVNWRYTKGGVFPVKREGAKRLLVHLICFIDYTTVVVEIARQTHSVRRFFRLIIIEL